MGRVPPQGAPAGRPVPVVRDRGTRPAVRGADAAAAPAARSGADGWCGCPWRRRCRCRCRCRATGDPVAHGSGTAVRADPGDGHGDGDGRAQAGAADPLRPCWGRRGEGDSAARGTPRTGGPAKDARHGCRAGHRTAPRAPAVPCVLRRPARSRRPPRGCIPPTRAPPAGAQWIRGACLGPPVSVSVPYARVGTNCRPIAQRPGVCLLYPSPGSVICV
ncbi:hypothetical protein DRB96_41860 [Streptomyces sp. ICC1]|nr:hypothetical protein DRB96_41860 [Streptomyces sp. ICC1]